MFFPRCVSVPDYFRLDGINRLHLLGLISRLDVDNCLESVSLDCYSGKMFYLADQEQATLCRCVENFSNVRHLRLYSVANDDILEKICQHCSSLVELDCSGSSGVNDASVEVLLGRKTIVRKGPLVKMVPAKNVFCACKSSLRLFRHQNTQITFHGRKMAEDSFPMLNNKDPEACSFLAMI